MASSAVETLVNGYNTDTPVSFYDYYNAYGRDHATSKWTDASPYSLGGRLQEFFKGTRSAAQQEYENYLTEYEYRRNQAAKATEWAREDSAVQRALADIERAGLNPWLALNGGSMSSAVNASQSEPVRYKTKESYLKSEKGKGQAGQLLGAAAKILMALAILG